MSKKKKLLIVDDDRDFTLVAVNFLSNFNFEIYIADDGLNGIFMASKNPEKLPDLIIMDINMAQLDGIETYRIMKQNPNLRNIPIIFVSAAVELEKICKDLHTDEEEIVYFKKPLKLNELVKKINEMLGIKMS
jgi:CheY-like chemotaxis protein